jgi:hypothetical protein
MRKVVTSLLKDPKIKRDLSGYHDVNVNESHRQRNIDAIKTHLSGFEGSGPQKRQAAENVYRALQYFGANKDLLTVPDAMDLFTDTVADYYALEWRNREMM